MFEKFFGLKSAVPPPRPPHPGPDSDGVARILPKSLWERHNGNMLHQLGFSPGDRANILPNPLSLEAKAQQALAEQNTFVAEVNAGLPGGVTVQPWALLPASLWTGPHARFLSITCDLFVASPWNTFLLPDTEIGAAVLDLPLIKTGPLPDLEQAAQRLVGEVHAKHRETFATVDAGLARGDITVLREYAKAKRAAQSSIAGLSFYLASTVYSEDAVTRHEAVFGATFGRKA
jgi:hypothetical protein